MQLQQTGRDGAVPRTQPPFMKHTEEVYPIQDQITLAKEANWSWISAPSLRMQYAVSPRTERAQ